MNNKVLTIVGVVALVLVVAGGAFFGGILYERSSFGRASLRAGFPAGAAGAPGVGGRTVGQVKSIDGNTMVVTLRQNEVTVALTDSTTVSKMAPGSLSDLQPGQSVSVRGDRDASGNVTATDIQILGQGTGTPTQ